MITKVLDGYRPAGLIRYLFGPGKFEEHRNPRVVASWDGAPWLHHPPKLPPVEVDGEVVEPGEFDFDLGPLTTTMQELAEAAGLPLRNPPAITPEWAHRVRAGNVPDDAPWWVKFYKYDRKKDAAVLRPGYVWHCPVRLHPTDRVLDDEDWETIAERLMKATGIHQAGCRWIAIRHANDHIHLMATLVSEHTGKRFYPYRDWLKLEEERQQLEREFGLVETASSDKTARRAPTRAEKGKAARLGRPVTAREELARMVAQSAASARDDAEFLAELASRGLNPTTATDATGRVRGYSVALPGDVTTDGTPVRYSGSELARDLTWPKLAARWATTPPAIPVAAAKDGRVPPAERRGVLEDTTAIVRRATSHIQNCGDDVEGIAHATGEILAVLARGHDGYEPGPLTEIADRYDRAARTPKRVLPERIGPVARDLRRTSRRIAAIGALSGRGKEKFALLALALALAGLIAEIAAWQQARGRIHQAAAAHTTADALPDLSRPATSARRSAPRPLPTRAAAGPRRKRPAVRHATASQDEARPRGKGPS